MKKFEYRTYISKSDDLVRWDDDADNYYDDSDSDETKTLKKKVSVLAMAENLTTQEYVVLEELNSLGKEGWELVAVIDTKDDKSFYFKREIA
jgi:hypothetical protein